MLYYCGCSPSTARTQAMLIIGYILNRFVHYNVTIQVTAGSVPLLSAGFSVGQKMSITLFIQRVRYDTPI